MSRHARTGIVLPLVLAVALVAVVLFLTLFKLADSTAREGSYLRQMNQTYRLAESGLQNALGQLANEQALMDGTAYAQATVLSPGGTYADGQVENIVQRSDTPVPSGFYIVTSATRTVRGHHYSCRLHTYARITNVNLYFAAVNDELVISDGANLDQGRIYAPRLRFIVGDSATPTRLSKAEFVDSCEPPLADWTSAVTDAVIISSPASHTPVQLSRALRLPELSDTDIARYKTWAGGHTTKNNFSGDIFPPGYQGAALAGDTYASAGLHTANNQHHIYFYDGDISIKGRVHGQVLFVATGDIHITGNLESAPLSDVLPGEGFISSSTAHQAVLISKKSVFIDATHDPATGPLKIEALIIAPRQTFIPMNYPDPDLSTPNNEKHDSLRLEFTGALIFRTLNSPPPANLVTVFNGGRTYSYMTSLATFPPPYLPAVTEIYYSLEETTSNSGVYQ